jgi:hypothetical protein
VPIRDRVGFFLVVPVFETGFIDSDHAARFAEPVPNPSSASLNAVG